MADEVKATDAAKNLAQEKGLDLSSVQGSGNEGAITKPDVEEALAQGAAEAPAEAPAGTDASAEKFYVKLNPGLAPSVTMVSVGDRIFGEGEQNPQNVVSQYEYDSMLKDAKDPTSGLQLLLKGGKA